MDTTAPSTLTLTDFLLARIAEDEGDAKACAEMFPPPWEVADRGWRVRIYSADVPDIGDHAEPGDVRTPCVIEVEPTRHYDDPCWLSERVAHIARHDPARVLAECAAKRRIVEDFAYHVATYRDHPTEFGEGQRFGILLAIGQLALVYADHPDYRDEWRP